MTTAVNFETPIVIPASDVFGAERHAGFQMTAAALNTGAKRIGLYASTRFGITSGAQEAAQALGFRSRIFNAATRSQIELQEILDWSGIGEMVLIINDREHMCFSGLPVADSQRIMDEMLAANPPKLVVMMHYDK